MRLSARSRLGERVVEVTKGQTTAHTRPGIGSGAVVTAPITSEAVDGSRLARGDGAWAVIEAADPMVGKE